jgi:hypothetical protein
VAAGVKRHLAPFERSAHPDSSDKGAERMIANDTSDDVMDPTIDAMLLVYAAALRRHRQHIEDRCDRRAWHELACTLVQRAIWSANTPDEPPLWSPPPGLDLSHLRRTEP